MAKPTFMLPLSGQTAMVRGSQSLDGEMQRVIDILWAAIQAMGEAPATLDEFIAEFEAIRDATINASQPLSSNRIYYVSTTGSDSNSGLSAGAPFATLQAAANATRNLRLDGRTVTVQIADGTYTAGVDVGGPVFGAPNVSNLAFVGNVANPAAVVVHVTGGNCFGAKNGARFHVEGVTLRTTGSGHCLNASSGGAITHGNVVFGACAEHHKQATSGGHVSNTGGYSVTGGAVSHLHATTGGYILVNNGTVTFTGTPAFSEFFIGISGAFVQIQNGVNWSGALTGRKFLVHNGGALRAFGLPTPGSTPGDAIGGGTVDDIHTLEVMRGPGPALLVANNEDATNGTVARFRGERATPTALDTFINNFEARNSAQEDTIVARQLWTLASVAAGAETGQLRYDIMNNGSLVSAVRMLVPTTEGHAAAQFGVLLSGSVVLKQVLVGAPDSGGTGFRTLRITN